MEYIVELYQERSAQEPSYRSVVTTSEEVIYSERTEVSGQELFAVTEGLHNPEILDLMQSDSWEKIVIAPQGADKSVSDAIVLGRQDGQHGICVEFGGNSLDSVVRFSKGERTFRVRLQKLQKKFQVRTLLEVRDYLKEYYNGLTEIDQVEEMFGAGIDDAVKLVGCLFEGRVDLDGNPDIIHVLSVGMAGKTRKEKLAGFLHDVIEDTGYRAEDLLCDGYPADVVEAVELLTRDESVPYMDYIRSILESGNTLAVNVKINDLRHNIARGKAGGNHNHLVVMHEVALAYISSRIAA